jgi:multimeric flavodoxin WrbA
LFSENSARRILKILTINGSRRKNGNTRHLIDSILAPANSGDVDTECVFLGDYDIGACSGCEGCQSSWECVIEDDFARIVTKLDEADGIVLASPTYWYSVTSDMKRFIDRCYSLIRFPVDRRGWIGKYRGAGKLCVTAAICEQGEASAMGNTSTLLQAFSEDIGLDVIEALEAFGFFAAGSITADQGLLKKAESAGQKLLSRMRAQPLYS